MQRLEDGAWDPRRQFRGVFYFTTTASPSRNSRLWRVRFDDIRDPLSGGAIEIVLRGDEGHQSLDNLAVDRLGNVLLQEDPGGTPRLAKIWLYEPVTEQLREVAAHNPEFFTPGAPGFLTTNEESSGIIDASEILGPGWYLLDVQAHYGLGGGLVQGGQLLALHLGPLVDQPAPHRHPNRNHESVFVLGGPGRR